MTIKDRKTLKNIRKEIDECIQNNDFNKAKALEERYEFILKANNLKAEKVEKGFSIICNVGRIVVPAVLYGGCFLLGLYFEETGSINSSVMRGILPKIRPN